MHKSAAAAAPIRPKFPHDPGFRKELRRRVDAYFEDAGRKRSGDWRMFLKTATMIAWFGASYVGLLVLALTWWQAVLLTGSLAFAIAGIGFCVMHDANHGAYSNRDGVNRIMERTLDVLGASSYMWRWKHNVFHHTYTNVSGADNDIDLAPFARLSPSQPRRWIHRFQHIYMWPLYGFTVYHMHYFEDFAQLRSGLIGGHRFPKPGAWHTFELFASKAVVLGWSLLLPMLFHSWWVVLLFYVALWFTVGLILTLVFQLAHCAEDMRFPAPDAGSGKMDRSWTVHQIETTADFGQRNWLLTWYVGGLNFQIEHHLFPGVCHVHYPKIANIVRELCAERGIQYKAHRSFTAALISHWRWLHRMGRPDVAKRNTESQTPGPSGATAREQ